MKKITLIPPDKKQCQGEKQVGAFTIGGQIGKRTRCTNIPTVIAYEKKPGTDGQKGSMSLCNNCRIQMIKQLGIGFAEIETIANIE